MLCKSIGIALLHTRDPELSEIHPLYLHLACDNFGASFRGQNSDPCHVRSSLHASGEKRQVVWGIYPVDESIDAGSDGIAGMRIRGCKGPLLFGGGLPIKP